MQICHHLILEVIISLYKSMLFLCYYTELKQLWEQNGHLYITEAAFNSCYKKMKDWINISTLMGHLMANGLVCGPEEVERVSSPYVPMGTRKMNLLELTKANGGRHGFFILYKCLRDSASDMPLGHGDAIEELEDYGKYNQHLCNSEHTTIYVYKFFFGDLVYPFP